MPPTRRAPFALAIIALPLALFAPAGCVRRTPESLALEAGGPASAGAREAGRTQRGGARYSPRLDSVSGRPLARPVAVMIENHPAARPQSGLDRADVVYEALSEGGITRFLAIFTRDDAPAIGPIRSARPCFIDLMQAFDPVYVHCGQSWDAEKILHSRRVDALNQLYHPDPFWRDPRRRRPHNLYASTASLLHEALRSGLAAGSADWPLPSAGDGFAGEPAAEVEIGYPYGLRYRVQYRYDRASRRYLRSVNGRPHRDAVTGRQLSAATVIVQSAATRSTRSRYGELEIDVLGSGRCWFARDGRWKSGRWVKPAPRAPVTFEGAGGQPLLPAPGPVWVQIIPVGNRPRLSGG